MGLSRPRAEGVHPPLYSRTMSWALTIPQVPFWATVMKQLL